MLTYTRLKELLNYDPDTGVFIWIKPTSNRVKINSVAGTFDTYGYLVIRIDSILYKAHRLAWLYAFEEYPENQIDHINGIKSDNRLDNLRDATSSQNMFNKPVNSANTTGYKGVNYRASMSKYRASIGYKGRVLHLGYFITAEEAHEAYKLKSIELYKEFSTNENNN